MYKTLVLGEPDILWGMSDGLIYDLVFDNVVIGNETIESIDHFYHNEYVFNWRQKWIKDNIALHLMRVLTCFA